MWGNVLKLIADSFEANEGVVGKTSATASGGACKHCGSTPALPNMASCRKCKDQRRKKHRSPRPASSSSPSVATLAVTNDENAAVAFGCAEGYSGLVYCGRSLGKDAIPCSNGQCGPDGGPQCGSCTRFQAARQASIAVHAAIRPYDDFFTPEMQDLVEEDALEGGIGVSAAQPCNGVPRRADQTPTTPFIVRPECGEFTESIKVHIDYCQTAEELDSCSQQPQGPFRQGGFSGSAEEPVQVSGITLERPGEVPLDNEPTASPLVAHETWNFEHDGTSIRDGAARETDDEISMIKEKLTEIKNQLCQEVASKLTLQEASTKTQEELHQAMAAKDALQVHLSDIQEQLQDLAAADVKMHNEAVEWQEQLHSAAASKGALEERGTQYYPPEYFGLVGERVELSNDNRSVARTGGVNAGVCIGAFPMQHFPEGRYFEVRVDEVSKSMRAIAIGVACRLNDAALCNGRIRATEARELERVWLAGYEKAGALFISDGKESKIPTTAWRPVSQIKAGTRLGVLWAEPGENVPAPTLVVFQDGEERVRLPACGQLPKFGEEIFALVDLQGCARVVTLLEEASPPKQTQEDFESSDSKLPQSAEDAA